MKTLFVISCLLGLSQVASAFINEESSLEFQVTPDSVMPEFTMNLTFLCALNDTYNTANISSIASVALSQGDDVIAVVNAEQPNGHLVTQKYDDVTVNGGLTGRPGVKCFLEVVFKEPTSQSTGKFQCKVYGFSKQGYIVQFKDSVFVRGTDPQVADLLIKLNSLEERLTHHISHLQDAVSTNTKTLDTLQPDVDTLQETVTDKNNTQSLISKLAHTQTGTFDCASADFYNGVNATRSFNYETNFTRAYVSPPTVYYSVYNIMGNVAGADTNYQVGLVQVKPWGFSIRCVAWGNSQIKVLLVRWTSVASFE